MAQLGKQAGSVPGSSSPELRCAGMCVRACLLAAGGPPSWPQAPENGGLESPLPVSFHHISRFLLWSASNASRITHIICVYIYICINQHHLTNVSTSHLFINLSFSFCFAFSLFISVWLRGWTPFLLAFSMADTRAILLPSVAC